MLYVQVLLHAKYSDDETLLMALRSPDAASVSWLGADTLMMLGSNEGVHALCPPPRSLAQALSRAVRLHTQVIAIPPRIPPPLTP